METKKLRPADCFDQATANKLETQGIKFNNYAISVKPSFVVLEIGYNTTVNIPMTVFERFAKWYLEKQDVEIQLPSTDTTIQEDDWKHHNKNGLNPSTSY